MRNLIQQTKAFQKMEGFQQQLALKRENRLKIEDAIITARVVGVDNWQAPKDFNNKWQDIVKEVVWTENKNEAI